MPIDLNELRNIKAFEKWFVNSGAKHALPTAKDYYKMILYESAVKSSERCPRCTLPANKRCRCPRADSECLNGHHWHICVVHQEIVEDESDHSVGIERCTCKQ